MKAITPAVAGLALTLNTIAAANAVPEDYAKELIGKHANLLMMQSKYNMLAAKPLMEQPSSTDAFFASCMQLEAGSLSVFSSSITNISNLALVLAVVKAPDERKVVEGLLQGSLAAARLADKSVKNAVSIVAKVPQCRDNDLTALENNLMSEVDSIEQTLSKMTP